MRTRRSPRNQEILWRALTSPVPPVVPTPHVPRCWDCVSYPVGGRSRGHCTLRGQMAYGATEQLPCHKRRG